MYIQIKQTFCNESKKNRRKNTKEKEKWVFSAVTSSECKLIGHKKIVFYLFSLEKRELIFLILNFRSLAIISYSEMARDKTKGKKLI